MVSLLIHWLCYKEHLRLVAHSAWHHPATSDPRFFRVEKSCKPKFLALWYQCPSGVFPLHPLVRSISFKSFKQAHSLSVISKYPQLDPRGPPAWEMKNIISVNRLDVWKLVLWAGLLHSYPCVSVCSTQSRGITVCILPEVCRGQSQRTWLWSSGCVETLLEKQKTIKNKTKTQVHFLSPPASSGLL